jgi:hypothetical protein
MIKATALAKRLMDFMVLLQINHKEIALRLHPPIDVYSPPPFRGGLAPVIFSSIITIP